MRHIILAATILAVPALAGCATRTPPLAVSKTNDQPTGAGQVGAPTGIRAQNGGGELTLGNNRPTGPISVTRVQ